MAGAIDTVTVLLTSFADATARPFGRRFSVARWAPDFARDWPRLPALAPFDAAGRPILLRRFPADPANGYRAAYYAALHSRLPAVTADLVALGRADVSVCCWCPATAKQRIAIEQHGSFFCHLLLLDYVFQWAGLRARLGPDHAARGAPAWRQYAPASDSALRESLIEATSVRNRLRSLASTDRNPSWLDSRV